MSYGYKSIKDQIVAVLSGVTSLKHVYSKDPKSVEQYPSAGVFAMGHTGRFDSMGLSGTNERVVQHVIRLYFRTDETNDPDYEDVLETVADDVLKALEANVTLNGSCEYSLPTTGNWSYGQKETPVRIFDIVQTSTLHLRRDTGELI